ncbi:DEAD/DEAH box helicase [Brevundimonas sp.]|jgi:transcription-repair coupling factor (superfamily II helicase)|uniref:DEAD/DEAH box helicase n=1 Tax=Brevundimonas sp. TaxID=1871086 RepID=UPI0037C15E9F
MAADEKDKLPDDGGLAPGPLPSPTDRDDRLPASAFAYELLGRAPDAPLILAVAAGERRAEETARALRALAGETAEVLHLPAWDSLPYDRAPPSRERMGQRMAVLQSLSRPVKTPRIIVASPAAIAQRVSATPPSGPLVITVGQKIDRDEFRLDCIAIGYVEDERVDEPGEVSILGEVVDVFPAAAAFPVRLDLDDKDRVLSIRAYDPATQRSLAPVEAVEIGAAVEHLERVEQADGGADATRFWPTDDTPLQTLFAICSRARVLIEADVAGRCSDFLELVADAAQATRHFRDGDRPAVDRLYLTPVELDAAFASAETLETRLQPVPSFASDARPATALRDFVEAKRETGARIVIAGLDHELKLLRRRLRSALGDVYLSLDSLSRPPTEPGAYCLLGDLDGGFRDLESGLIVLTPTDVVGGRIAEGTASTLDLLGDDAARIGDVVIHEDHGLGVVEALETVSTDGQDRDVLKLRYHGDATLMAPVEDLPRIWRYGSEPQGVTLDRLNGTTWPRRRAEVSAEIDAAAKRLAADALARAARRTDPLVAPAAAFKRIAARFPYPETRDQIAAIEAVLADLKSGRPMNRLVCGDVGFGKTEVALRAAAAVALCERQVLVIAPTTVLARQHYESFRRRCEGSPISVAHLSRLVDSGEARSVREGLAERVIDIVVGTQALAQDLTLAAPGLVIIDEEHRFGASLKESLGQAAPHVLSLTATPIPRTLQSAMVGLQDVSVIATPPARRRPIRTVIAPFDAAAVRAALLREKARGGQSFLVVPRISDIAPMEQALAEIAPELTTVVVHGRRSAEQVDDAVVAFAEGIGDVMLATNIIENGLDVPRANTMLIYRPDRFGLAQLHQLRGRVGRGRRQGVAHLLTEPDDGIAEDTLARLRALEQFDRLGAGFALSVRDLDLRGGGDLIGEAQAGHVKLIGAGLYQTVLARALGAARGDVAERGPPELSLPGGAIPPDYVTDANARISLYTRFFRAEDIETVERLAQEMEDRFGSPPPQVLRMCAHARLRVLAAWLGVRQIVAGPKATALTFGEVDLPAIDPARVNGRWSEGRLIVDCDQEPHELAQIETMVETLGA